jgi:hypothetical protein
MSIAALSVDNDPVAYSTRRTKFQKMTMMRAAAVAPYCCCWYYNAKSSIVAGDMAKQGMNDWLGRKQPRKGLPQLERRKGMKYGGCGHISVPST